MQWCRLHHDTPTDPKWRTIARRSGQPVERIIAVWVFMLTNASASTERGTLEGWDDEDVAGALDVDPDDIAAIRNAMQGKTLDGDRLTGWDKRQPKRERIDDSRERVKAHRQRQEPQETAIHDDVTPCNATQRHETPRLDERRLDKKEPPSPNGDAPPKSKSKGGTRLPDDWHPSPDEIEFAKQCGVDPDTEAPKFRDYWHGIAGAKGRKQDWPATWRNWCRRAAEDAQNRKPRDQPSGVPPARNREVPYAEWETRVRKFHDRGFWLNGFGPRPDMTANEVPKAILEKFGYAAR